MGQQAGDEGVGLLGQAPLVAGIIECVLSITEQGHIGVHSRAVDAEDGLRHKGGVEAVLLSQGFYRQLEGHDVVGGVEGFLILEVDLMLARGHLVVAGLDLKAHLLQGHADLPAGALAVIQGAQVEVARLVVGLGGGTALVVGLEQEELGLGPHVEGVIPHVLGPLKDPLQGAAGIAHKGSAVGVVDIADQPGNLAVAGPPGENHEGVQIGIEILVGLVDADETLDGGAVEHNLVVDRLLDLGGGDGHVLQLTENVGELEADKLDILLVDDADNIFLGVRHCRYLLSLFHIERKRRRRSHPGRVGTPSFSTDGVSIVWTAVFVNRKLAAQKNLGKITVK